MTRTNALSIATCQFPVSEHIPKNSRYIQNQIAEAKRLGADIVHFSELALSGYGGVEYDSLDELDWPALERETQAVLDCIRREKVWVLLGSTHRLSPEYKPHNSTYLIDPSGKVVDRYDKRFCTAGDLNHYTSGDHFVTFDINGVKCGLLICYDIRFPELYREYRRMGVQVMFHSFYNARAQGRNIHTTIMRPSLQERAATNYMWVSANNSSGYYQSWPSVFIRPNGEIAQSLRQHKAGAMVNIADTTEEFYDASAPFRDRALSNILHSGELVDDPRSADRVSI
ncbi:MAG: carbon-nitrogen hydrolase family protein [Chloroflexi bacterium]|nr:carbon-nitrogen hydrolase family protein [Chloroflexota bacterium]